MEILGMLKRTGGWLSPVAAIVLGLGLAGLYDVIGATGISGGFATFVGYLLVIVGVLGLMEKFD